MTWFDGRPEHLWQYPPREEGQRYVECFGGVDGLCDKAETFIHREDYRFAATLLAHAVAADPENASQRAQDLLATAYEKLGYGAENATWRNFYLTAAQELQTGKKAGMVAGGRTPLGEKLQIEQWFEILSVQLDGTRAAQAAFSIDLDVTDAKEKWRLILSNGVLTRRPLGREPGDTADVELVLTRLQLLELIRGNRVPVEREAGDSGVVNRFVDLIRVDQGSSRGPSQI